MAKIFKDPDGIEFACAESDTILRAALRNGLGMPYSCNTGSCGNCRFELLEGEVAHLRKDPPAWSERDMKRNRWLGCQAAPKGDCRIKFRAMDQFIPVTPPSLRRAVLLAAKPITHDISEFTFRIDGNPAFIPGQYALFHVPGVVGCRAYSMSNLPSDGDWRFMIKRTPGGAATSWLTDHAKPGQTIDIDGPYGTASLRQDAPNDIVLIAGGSGLSPMVSIARGAADTGMLATRKLHLFYGGRTGADLCDISVFGPHMPGDTTFTAALSAPKPTDDWQGPTGFLHDIVQEKMGGTLKACKIYFAGPAVMSAALQKMLHEAGVPQDQVHFDEFY